jgi:hypothetical protein
MLITPDTELCERRASINETATLSRCYPDACSGFLLAWCTKAMHMFVRSKSSRIG